MTHYFDVLIIGAGPAGSTCALALRDSGLQVGLLDKATFPRDKICGDAIPGPAFKVLQAISPKFGTAMSQFKKGQKITTSKIIAPNGKAVTMQWVTQSYNAARMDFDTFLWELVREGTSTIQIQNQKVISISNIKEGYLVKTNRGIYCAKFLVGADGANSICARQLTGFQLDKQHHCTAVRAYYKNVKGIQATVNEFYLLKGYIPGYFWIFPLADGRVNVGFGMLTKQLSNKKISIKKCIPEIVSHHPLLKKRFETAQLQGKVQGFGLPLGSRQTQLAGERILLCGDAGSLIDPLQGHGIDKAMWSAYLAANQIRQCFEKERFDTPFLKNYEQAVYQKFGKTFQMNYRFMQWMGKFPWALNWICTLGENKWFNQLLHRFT